MYTSKRLNKTDFLTLRQMKSLRFPVKEALLYSGRLSVQWAAMGAAHVVQLN
jgi:hypothetical protein